MDTHSISVSPSGVNNEYHHDFSIHVNRNLDRISLAESSSRHASFPRDLVADPRLTDADVRVLLALDHFAGDGDECWPSVEAVARRLARSIRSIQVALSRLASLGLVSFEADKSRNGPDEGQRRIRLSWRSKPQSVDGAYDDAGQMPEPAVMPDLSFARALAAARLSGLENYLLERAAEVHWIYAGHRGSGEPVPFRLEMRVLAGILDAPVRSLYDAWAGLVTKKIVRPIEDGLFEIDVNFAKWVKIDGKTSLLSPTLIADAVSAARHRLSKPAASPDSQRIDAGIALLGWNRWSTVPLRLVVERHFSSRADKAVELSPSEIGKKLGGSRQAASRGIQLMVKSSIVVRDGLGYRLNPDYGTWLDDQGEAKRFGAEECAWIAEAPQRAKTGPALSPQSARRGEDACPEAVAAFAELHRAATAGEAAAVKDATRRLRAAGYGIASIYVSPMEGGRR